MKLCTKLKCQYFSRLFNVACRQLNGELPIDRLRSVRRTNHLFGRFSAAHCISSSILNVKKNKNERSLWALGNFLSGRREVEVRIDKQELTQEFQRVSFLQVFPVFRPRPVPPGVTGSPPPHSRRYASGKGRISRQPLGPH